MRTCFPASPYGSAVRGLGEAYAPADAASSMNGTLQGNRVDVCKFADCTNGSPCPRTRTPGNSRMSEGSRMYLEAGEPKCEGNRSPSGVIGLRVLDVQPVEKLPSCPFGPELVKDRVLPVLRDQLVFAFGL